MCYVRCVSARVRGVACSLSGCVIIVFTVLRPLRVHCTAVRLLYLLYFGLHEFIALRCVYCTYCASAYTSPLRHGTFTAPIAFQPTRVHCATVRLLHLLCFGLKESIVSRCPYCTYCTSSYIKLLYLLYFVLHEFIVPRCAYCTYCISAYLSSLHCVRLLYLLYFSLSESIVSRYPYCAYYISACMSYLEATTNQLEGYQRGRQREAVRRPEGSSQREAVRRPEGSSQSCQRAR